MKKNIQNAFSLMEMMVVLLIVSIIAAATAPMVTKKMARSAGSGDSPWVFTGLSNNIAYNMNGSNNTTAIIGATSLPRGWNQHTRLFIDSGDNASHIAFGNGNTEPLLLTADPTNGRIGFSNTEIPIRSIAFGTGQTISNVCTGLISIGHGARAGGTNTRGDYGNNAIAIGINAQALDNNSVAIGNNAQSKRSGYWGGGSTPWQSGNNIAIGNGAESKDYCTIAIGNRARTSDSGATNDNDSDNPSSSESSDFAIAIGNESKAGANRSIAIGNEAEIAYGHTESIAIGNKAKVSHKNSIAIGNGVETSASNQIVLGTANDTVYIPGHLIVGLQSFFGSSINGGAMGIYGRFGGDGAGVVASIGHGGGLWDAHEMLDLGYAFALKKISDRRLKNVGDKYTAGLEELKKLDFYNYTFKADKENTPLVGVMAQDLQKVFPDAVTKGDDGYLRIRLEDMFYAVINAVKELDTKISEIVTTFNSKFDNQNQRMENLEKQNSELAKQSAELTRQNAELIEEIKNLEKRVKKLEK